jgi:hypothetical protein
MEPKDTDKVKPEVDKVTPPAAEPPKRSGNTTKKKAEAVVPAEPLAPTFLLAYLGPEDTHPCYRTTPHIQFNITPQSDNRPVAMVPEEFGEFLISQSYVKTYANGKPREPEDWLPAYAWFDDLAERRIRTIRREVVNG